MSTQLLYLIKSFVDQRIVYFWADAEDNPESPYLHSFCDAQEWWLAINFALYTGKERRASTVDRRRLHTQRLTEARSRPIPSHQPDGRRYTDIEIKVDKDLSRVSMLQFYASNPHLLNSSAESTL